MPEERRRRACGTSAKARLLVEKTIRARPFDAVRCLSLRRRLFVVCLAGLA